MHGMPDAARSSEHTVARVLRRCEPAPDGAAPAPVVFDSPHSGSVYPADFGYAAPFDLLRRTEDAFVDELFAAAPRFGAALLAALFPRSYIDPNRHEADIDALLLADDWPHEARPSERSGHGLGLVRRLVRSDVPVYDRRLTAAEILARIDRCHRPYHATLKAMLDGAHARFGAVWHVNCHSMRSTGRRGLDGGVRRRADFVLGDRDGTTCGAEFTAFVGGMLAGFGYSVAVNAPFKGAELVTRHGDPARNRHSLQIEINRRLYMDERGVEKTAGFERLRADLEGLIAAITDFTRHKTVA